MKDWNPSHFFDVAEIAAAVATGYDWLYQTLTPERRTMCEQAIIEKALKTCWLAMEQPCGKRLAVAN